MTTETITITVPATVAARVVGVDREINVADMAAESLAYAFTYGVRRLYQDNGNAVAKTARDEGKEPDADAIFAARHEQMKSGEFNTRAGSSGETFTDMENTLYDVAIEAKSIPGWSEIATTFAGMKGKPTDERKRAVLDTVQSLDKKRRTKLETIAKRRLESIAELAL